MTQWEEIADICREMFDGGYDVMLGPHASGLLGYYACFYMADDMAHCEVCDNHAITWIDCGHGDTLLEAVEMARAIALELPVDVPATESFLP
jgi:L-alanine-DL-glutamate epimerase-like enolase superfamily enzyme